MFRPPGEAFAVGKQVTSRLLLEPRFEGQQQVVLSFEGAETYALNPNRLLHSLTTWVFSANLLHVLVLAICLHFNVTFPLTFTKLPLRLRFINIFTILSTLRKEVNTLEPTPVEVILFLPLPLQAPLLFSTLPHLTSGTRKKVKVGMGPLLPPLVKRPSRPSHYLTRLKRT